MQFWAENPRCIFSSLDIFPNSSMTIDEKLNALTRLIILISIIMYALKNKYSWIVLLAGIAGVLFLYYMFIKKHKREGFYTEYPDPEDENSVEVSSQFSDIPVASLPVNPMPIASLPLASLPIASLPIGSMSVTSMPIASSPIGSSEIPGMIRTEGVSNDFFTPITSIPQEPYVSPNYYQVSPHDIPIAQGVPVASDYDFKKLTPIGNHLQSLAAFHTSQLNIQANHIQEKAIEGIIKHRNRFASQQNSAWGGVNVPY